MANVGYDSGFDFGEISAEGTFPNTLDLGASRIGRLTVDVYAKRTDEGEPLTAEDGFLIEISGGNTEAADGGIIGARTATAAEMNGAGFVKVAISPNDWRYIAVRETGEFEGGKLSAVLNTYLGK